MKIGNAKYGGGFTKKTYFKLGDGESVFRILPPLGDLAEAGRWSVFYNVHYGYKNTQGKMRAFQSPLVKNRKTKMIEVPDAAAERIQLLMAKLEEAKKNKNESRVKELLTLVGGTKSLYNLDSHHYMNVIDLDGKIGILKIRHRAKLALDAEIERLRKEGVDPLSVDNGRFFVFRRTGTALETTFQVTVYQESQVIAGQKVKVEKVHALDDALIARLGREAGQLDKLFKRPTAEEVELIVKNSDIRTGVSPACDEIFDKVQAAAAEEASSDEPDSDYQEPTAQGLGKSATAPTQAPTQAMPAPKAAPTPAPAQATPAPAARPVVQDDQSDADFLKSLGL